MLRCAAAPEPSSGAWGSAERCGISGRAHRHSGMAAVGSASVWGKGTIPQCPAGGCQCWQDRERVGLCVTCVWLQEKVLVAVSHGTEAAPLPQQGQCCSMGCC